MRLKGFGKGLLSIALIFSLISCGGGVSVEDIAEPQTAEPEETTNPPADNTDNPNPGDGTNGGTPTVEVNTPPTALINSPLNGSTHTGGQGITFAGSGYDLEDGALPCSSLIWVSGTAVIGTGCQFTKAFSNEGSYTVVLLVKDSKGAASSASRGFIVVPPNTPPTVSVDTPGGDIYNAGDSISFIGNGTDTDGSLGETSYVWVINGATSGGDPYYDTWTGQSFITNTLSPGIYNATLTVTDSGGASISNTTTITINDGGGGGPPPSNTAPVAIINSPTNGSEYLLGEPIVFFGKGIDTEDGNLSDSSLAWDMDGLFLGTGSFTRTDLVNGTHVITLTATDSGSASNSASVSITVLPNTPPTAKITSPTNGSSFSLGDTIAFAGTATDTEDGELSEFSLAWTDNGNILQLGNVFTSSALTNGTHIITLTATDSQGATATDSITINVIKENSSPIAAISKPTNGSTHTQGAYIDFAGSGYDADGDALTLVWMSDGVPIGTGNSFIRKDLSQGTHTITLIAIDSKGATGTASVTISVVANGQPSATITSPTSGSSYTEGDAVSFSGSGNDPEDGNLTGNSLVWTTGATVIGTGASFTKNNLAVGSHTIALIAVDKYGSSSVVTVNITIKAKNKLPVVSISSPADKSVFINGASISFSGSADDPEDGPISGGYLSWSSSTDGPLGSGSSLTVNNMSVGTRTITLSATDSAGEKGTASIVISVNPSLDADFAFSDFFDTDPNYNGYWTIYRYAGDASKEASYGQTEKAFYLTRAYESLGTAVFANYDLSAQHWQADFNFKMGGGVYGGEGFVFMFYKNKSCYPANKPASGRNLGYICDNGTGGEGYGIEFDNSNNPYNNTEDITFKHIALLSNGTLKANHIGNYVSADKADNEWHYATVVFNNGNVKLYIDDTTQSNAPLLDHTVSGMSYAYNGVGFGAATMATGGGATNNHVIDGFTIKLLP